VFSVRWNYFGVRLDIFVIMYGELNSESCSSSLINEKQYGRSVWPAAKALRCSAHMQTSQNKDGC
jgi:hypothetical protein